MSSLSYFLDRTDQSIESIQSLRFHPPGLFTNAIVKRPSITTLLKDPSTDEGALYKVTKPRFRVRNASPGTKESDTINRLNMEVRPERVDGKSVYIERSFTEDVQYKGEPKEDTDTDKEGGNGYRRTVVQLPELTSGKNHTRADVSSSPTKRHKPEASSFFSITDTDDVDKLCTEILEVIQKHPNLIEHRDSIVDKVIQSQNEYKLLENQCAQLESEIDDQKKQLTILNINYSDIGSPIKSKSGSASGSASAESNQVFEDETFDIEDYIRQEQEEIRRLEEQLGEIERG